MAKIHYDELTVGVPSKASSVNYENADGTKESVQSKISKILQTEEDTQDDIEGIKQNIVDLQKHYVDVLGGIKDLTIGQLYSIDLSQYTELIIKISLSGAVKYAPLYWHKDMGYSDAYCISNYYSSAYCGSIEIQVRENGLLIPSDWTAVKYNNNTVTTFKVSVIGR